MKTESGPLKYRLARRRVYGEFQDPFAPEVYEYVLQGLFHIDEITKDGFREHSEEWRTLETVDLDKEA